MTASELNSSEKQRVKMLDVAALAGVSRTAVSCALNGKPGVSSETRARIISAAKKLHYRPNVTARSLRTGRAPFIGIIVPSIRNPFYAHLSAAMLEDCRRRGYTAVIVQLEEASTELADEAESLIEHRCSGFIFATVRDEDAPLLLALRARGLPFVEAVRYTSLVDADVACIDDRRAAYELLTKVLETSARNVYVLTGPQGSSARRHRLDGFRDAYRATCGRELAKERIIECQFNFRDGYVYALKIFEHDQTASALICGDDMIAAGALQALSELRRRVPEDVVVTGFDDLEYACWDSIGLSTVRYPIEDVAAHSVDLLMTRFERPDQPYRTVMLPYEVFLRSSSASAPALR